MMLEFLNECIILGLKASLGMFIVSTLTAFLVFLIREIVNGE